MPGAPCVPFSTSIPSDPQPLRAGQAGLPTSSLSTQTSCPSQLPAPPGSKVPPRPISQGQVAIVPP